MSVALGEYTFYGAVFMLLYKVLKDIEFEINKIVNNKQRGFFSDTKNVSLDTKA